MSLEAKLTVGWPEVREESLSARYIVQQAMLDESGVGRPISELLPEDHTIRNLDELVRRDSSSYKAVKELMSALLSYNKQTDKTIVCEVDIFSYAFLSAAKNFDFFLPMGEIDDPTKKILGTWSLQLKELEKFERLGQLPLRSLAKSKIHQQSKSSSKSGSYCNSSKQDSCDWSVTVYLKLREIVTRPSARDELRALYIFLYSGPSTDKQIADELGLNESLATRVVAALDTTGALEVSGIDEVTNDDDPDKTQRVPIHRIHIQHIPIVVFLIRETLGCDLLPVVFNSDRE